MLAGRISHRNAARSHLTMVPCHVLGCGGAARAGNATHDVSFCQSSLTPFYVRIDGRSNFNRLQLPLPRAVATSLPLYQ